MGFEILPILNGDEDKYDIITITSTDEWTPYRFQGKHTMMHANTNTEPKSYDPSDTLLEMGELPCIEAPKPDEDLFYDCIPPSDPNFILNQLSYEETTGKHHVPPSTLGYPHSYNHHTSSQVLPMEDMDFHSPCVSLDQPSIDTYILATTAWHRVTHQEIDP